MPESEHLCPPLPMLLLGTAHTDRVGAQEEEEGLVTKLWREQSCSSQQAGGALARQKTRTGSTAKHLYQRKQPSSWTQSVPGLCPLTPRLPPRRSEEPPRLPALLPAGACSALVW